MEYILPRRRAPLERDGYTRPANKGVAAAAACPRRPGATFLSRSATTLSVMGTQNIILAQSRANRVKFS
jgi:hypothetical protein